MCPMGKHTKGPISQYYNTVEKFCPTEDYQIVMMIIRDEILDLIDTKIKFKIFAKIASKHCHSECRVLQYASPTYHKLLLAI